MKKLDDYVYVIKFGRHHKIGRSYNPEQRLTKLTNVKMPYEFELVYKVKTKHSYSLEKALHKKFSHKRIAGEWFRLNWLDLYLLNKEKDDIWFHANENTEVAHLHLSKKAPNIIEYLWSEIVWWTEVVTGYTYMIMRKYKNT